MKIFKAMTYTGTKLGNSGYMERKGVQIVCEDSETGKRVYAFTQSGRYRTYKTPTLKTFEAASHYKSGMNKADSARFVEALKAATKEATRLNRAEAKKEARKQQRQQA